MGLSSLGEGYEVLGWSVSLKIGDSVTTHDNESGVIVSQWVGTRYSWWVDITFTYDEKEYTSTIPYRESELTLLQPN